jgi:fructose-1,6-bisphosphatase I
MDPGATLEQVLDEAGCAPDASVHSGAVGDCVLNMAQAAISLAEIIARPPLNGRLGDYAGSVNSDGDAQRALDVVAEDLFSRALRRAPVAAYVSEETPGASLFDPDAPLALAIDPLDGSSSIDVNSPIGSLFSILPMVPEAVAEPALAFRQTGRAQLAAGFFVYGPQTALILSTGAGVDLFVYSREVGNFLLVDSDLAIPKNYPEYAINASNYRHWRAPVRQYIDDCVAGADGPRGVNFNTRWMAALVADAFRIFTRGGIYLYPSDARKGYEHGRLRLLYEANPMAFLMEKAGGLATDCVQPILDITPTALHERVPLVMGSADKVELVRRYHLEMSPPNRESPLFGRRGLMRG